jgi:hypothetical protein
MVKLKHSRGGAGHRLIYMMSPWRWVAADSGGWIPGYFRTPLGAALARASR